MTESSFDFFLYLTPTLFSRAAYGAHPEYADLFLSAKKDLDSGTVCFFRKSAQGEFWLAVSCSEYVSIDVRRDSFGDFADLVSARMKGVCAHPVFPALVMKGTLDIRGRGTETVRFALSAGTTREEAVLGVRRVLSQSFEGLRKRYRQALESFYSGMELRSADHMIFDYLTAKLFLPGTDSAAKKKTVNYLPGNTLWKYGISGDLPLIVLRIGPDSVSRILPFIKVVGCFSYAKLPADLIVIYREAQGYDQPIRTSLESMVSDLSPELRKRIFLLNIQVVDEYLFFQKVSRVFLNLDRGWKISVPQRTFRPVLRAGSGVMVDRILCSTGRGGYVKDRGFAVAKREKPSLRPWSLVLGNGRLGTVVNERGLGYSFAGNASERRLTPRRKTPGFSPGGELLYAVIRGKRYDLLANAQVTFYPHKAVYRIKLFDAEIKTEVFVPAFLPAKILHISVRDAKEEISSVVYDPKIILGKTADGTVTRISEEEKTFFSNGYNASFNDGHAVLFGVGAMPDGDILRFYPKGEEDSATMGLAFGSGKNSASAVAGILSRQKRIQREFQKAKDASEPFLRIETPDKGLNYFVNGFLQQQVRISRMLTRTGPYQPGGAFGFRDQLQDAMCLSLFEPAYLKHQILRCCKHQFEEGDVLHWWHPRSKGKDDGIRTRFSDDPFWLVFACGEYYQKTGDPDFLNRSVSYLAAPPLEESENDRYFTPEKSGVKESVYRHAMRAFRYGYKTGDRGLILFGAGDWNDGMNRIGAGGETVWGSMLAVLCVEKFLPVAVSLGKSEDAQFLRKCGEQLRSALEKHAYDGSRYIRGVTADGTPFGAGDCIDLIPQAFAAFCGLQDKETAMETAYRELWDKDLRLIRLLNPPYQSNPGEFPGSIGEYPPGVRENGGQYTHAGVWFAKALLQNGKVEKGTEILLGINPVSRCKTEKEAEIYGGEPYVMAADVYTLPGREGTAGWTHYTGAAGWYLNTVTEDLLGIRRIGNSVSIRPSIPKDWNGYRATVRIGNDKLKIQTVRGNETGIYESGEKRDAILLDGTEHDVTVIIQP